MTARMSEMLNRLPQKKTRSTKPSHVPADQAAQPPSTILRTTTTHCSKQSENNTPRPIQHARTTTWYLYVRDSFKASTVDVSQTRKTTVHLKLKTKCSNREAEPCQLRMPSCVPRSTRSAPAPAIEERRATLPLSAALLPRPPMDSPGARRTIPVEPRPQITIFCSLV